jgi:hypothetical protein
VRHHVAVTLLVRIGFVVVSSGLAGDIVAHTWPTLAEPILGSGGYGAHLVTFVGMLLVVGGLLLQGLHQSRKDLLVCRLAAFSTRFLRPFSSSSIWPRS